MTLPEIATADARRRTSPRMFAYLLREFLAVAALCTCAFLTLFLIETLFDDLPDFLQQDASLTLALRYFLLMQPEKLAYVLPMATLLSAMYVVASLCRYNELTALSASGQSLMRVCVPMWTAAVAIAGIHFAAAEYVAPRFTRQATALHQRLKDPLGIRANTVGTYLAYHNKVGRRTWLFEDFQPTGVSTGVIVTSFRPDGTAESELRAATVRYEGYWLFEDGVLTLFDESGQLPDGEPQTFTALDRRAFDENPETLRFRFHLKPAGAMTISELRRVLDARGERLPAATEAVLRTQLWARATAPLACVVAVLLGVPLAVVRERKSPVWSFVAAAALMGGYYVAMQIALAGARTAILPVSLAALSPPLLFAAWGAYLTYKRR